ncbi:hypothetical protein AAG570_002116 [Ranatra chinensis]|uniref:Uncharacterized protein n=1 Tax=Ranatra chinensis TaxID=642074 RepID=A0ABD0YPD7_9HEMI
MTRPPGPEWSGGAHGDRTGGTNSAPHRPPRIRCGRSDRSATDQRGSSAGASDGKTPLLGVWKHSSFSPRVPADLQARSAGGRQASPTGAHGSQRGEGPQEELPRGRAFVRLCRLVGELQLQLRLFVGRGLAQASSTGAATGPEGGSAFIGGYQYGSTRPRFEGPAEGIPWWGAIGGLPEARQEKCARKIVRYLTEGKFAFHTYQIKSERAYRVVLRGLHQHTPLQEIIRDIEEQEHKCVWKSPTQGVTWSSVNRSVTPKAIVIAPSLCMLFGGTRLYDMFERFR